MGASTKCSARASPPGKALCLLRLGARLRLAWATPSLKGGPVCCAPCARPARCLRGCDSPLLMPVQDLISDGAASTHCATLRVCGQSSRRLVSHSSSVFKKADPVAGSLVPCSTQSTRLGVTRFALSWAVSVKIEAVAL